MGLKHGLLPCLAMVVISMVLLDLTDADIDKDKQQCGDQLVGLMGCLPYVGGEAKAPTMGCCNGLKLVLAKSKVCLCILIKDHNDPSLGLKINDTLALGLPDSCHMTTNISECLGLLHLQPGSPDAKVFEDYAKVMKSKNTTIAQPGNATKGDIRSSDGERRTRWLGVEVVGLLFITLMLNNDYNV